MRRCTSMSTMSRRLPVPRPSPPLPLPPPPLPPLAAAAVVGAAARAVRTRERNAVLFVDVVAEGLRGGDEPGLGEVGGERGRGGGLPTSAAPHAARHHRPVLPVASSRRW